MVPGPVPVPTFEKVMVPVPVPTFEKLRPTTALGYIEYIYN